MAKAFPVRIFVTPDPNNDTGRPQFLADIKDSNLIEEDGPTQVATYKLVTIRKLRKITQEG